MLLITIQVNRPVGHAIGVKEQLAQDLEKYGDVRVVSVEEVKQESKFEQMKLDDHGIGR